MAIRTITWTVGGNMEVSPASIQKAGVQGDHEATCVRFLLPEILQTGYALSVEQISSTDAYDTSPALTVEDGAVSFLLPRAWTQDGGKAVLRLVATAAKGADEGEDVETVYSAQGRIVYADRQNAFKRAQTLIAGTVQHLLEVCRRAVAKVDRAGEAAENFVEQLPDMAAGKNCYRVIEQNKHVAMGVWVGTSEEYDALEEEPNNTIVLDLDDEEWSELLLQCEQMEETISLLSEENSLLKASLQETTQNLSNLQDAFKSAVQTITVTEKSDFNLYVTTCLLYFNFVEAGHDHAPTTGFNGFVKVYGNNGNGYCVQIAFQTASSATANAEIFVRRQVKGEFSTWRKFTLAEL